LGITGTLHAQKIELAVPEISVYSNFFSIRLNWCAPACAECVLKYHNINIDQCDIMNYIRINFGMYGGSASNILGCCSVDPPIGSHPCDEKVPLGFYNEPVSIKNIIKHFSNGTLSGPTANGAFSIKDITYFITHNQLLLAQWEWTGTDKAHVVVIYGIDGDIIWYMDPDGGKKLPLSYNKFVSNGNRKWAGTLLCCPATREHPCHCYNNQYDPDLDEEGIDCGGECPKCSTPPLNHCYNGIPDADETGVDCGGADCPECTLCNNCTLDPGELEMDCGGTCPPCKYIGNVTDERIITNTAQLLWEMKAFNKITACCATTVASGKEVSFITEPTGSIVLLPGFKAEEGSTFRTQMKDLSKDKRRCGGICHDYTLPTALTKPSDDLYISNLYISNLLYAVQFNYNIYNSGGEIIFYNFKTIESDGDFYLWDCLHGVYDGVSAPTGRKDFKLEYFVYYCNGTKLHKEHNFHVNYVYEKSLPEPPDAPETPPQFSPPHPDNTPDLSATTPPHFSIIPNPNPGTFQLETNFPLFNIGNLKITNMIGVTVFETQQLSSATLQLPNSPAGHYFVVMILKDGTMLTQKMMIQQ